MTLRYLLIVIDADAESCGECPQRYTYGPESDGYACHKFPGRIFGRNGYRRLDACIRAEARAKTHGEAATMALAEYESAIANPAVDPRILAGTLAKILTNTRTRVEEAEAEEGAGVGAADPMSEDDEESGIVIAGRRVPFVQVGMIVHSDDCLHCERDGNSLWCAALVCDIHDDDETARFGMTATLLFRNGERREEPCNELRRRWRMARDFDQGRVYTGRWGAIPRGSVWPVAEVNEDA